MRDSIQATKLLLGSSFLNWRRGEKYHKAIYEDWKFIAARFFSCAFCGPSRRSLLLLPPRPPPPLNKLVRRHAAWGGAQKPLRWLTPIADSPLFLREPPLSFIIYPKPIERCCSHKKRGRTLSLPRRNIMETLVGKEAHCDERGLAEGEKRSHRVSALNGYRRK